MTERSSDIAIIGISCLLPGAQTPQKYWENLLAKVVSICEIPKNRWDWRLFYDPDKNAPDKTYSKWGGFFGEIHFDPVKYGIPPNSIRSIDPMQLLTLEVVRRALEDAGYEEKPFDRENTSVILGAGGSVSDMGTQYAIRTELPQFVDIHDNTYKDRLPEWSEESFTGILNNILSGRVSNFFDLGGMNFTVHAACASSLTAMNIAVNELESGRSNIAITGGVDTSQSPFSYLCFSKSQALSPRGISLPFDKSADGIVISEGIAIAVLKRLDDAKRDRDRIYAVIKGMGSSSDGKAKSLYAPNPEGQIRALSRAYKSSGISPTSIRMIEAHGTGTVAGDESEIETVTKILKTGTHKPGSCVIGSAKALIGHTKATAGIASIIKTTLALYHKVQPPHHGVSDPLEPLVEENSPLCLLNNPKPWFSSPDHPRRAGVSAFGFGGTNVHAVLEETCENPENVPAGSHVWPCELFVFRSFDKNSLIEKLKTITSALNSEAAPEIKDLAYSFAIEADANKNLPVCMTVTAGTLEQFSKSLNSVLDVLEQNSEKSLPRNIELNLECDPNPGKIVFMFPGQGSQYVDMAREQAIYFKELRLAIENADRLFKETFPIPLNRYIYPPASFSVEKMASQSKALTATGKAQPAIASLEAGFLDIAIRLGLKPDITFGHSLGEYTALHASGAVSRRDFFNLIKARAKTMARAAENSPGAMAAIMADRTLIQEHIDNFEDVIVANHNAPLQSVISGPRAKIEQALESFKAQGFSGQLLTTGGAFHSALFSGAQETLNRKIMETRFHAPKIPVYSNLNAEKYPADAAGIAKALVAHLLNPVEFVKQVNAVYNNGARIFVELGPKNILSGLVGQSLEGKKHTTVSFDGYGGGLKGFLKAIGILLSEGVRMDILSLFRERDVRALDLSKLNEITAPKPPSPTTWIINGGNARKYNEPAGHPGKLPPMTLEDRGEKRKTPEPHQTTMGFPSVPPVPGNLSQEVMLSYQDTMRRFLEIQERIMNHALGAGTAPVTGQPVQSILKQPDIPDVNLTPEKTSHGDGDLTEILLEIVSKRTGYPKEVLGIDQDMEAELGIDSIKRIDILESLQDHLPENTARLFLEQVETFARLRSLGDILENITRITEDLSPPARDKTGETSPLPDKTVITDLLLKLVSDRTGYPKEVLGLELDMEAELGIDSIKRIDILESLLSQLPGSTADAAILKIENFSRMKTLNEVIEGVMLIDAVPENISIAPIPEKKALLPERPDDQPLPRFLMKAVEKPLPRDEVNAAGHLEGLYIITRDSFFVAPELAEAVKNAGAEAEIINDQVLCDSKTLSDTINRLRKHKGPVTGIIHLVPLKKATFPDSLESWRQNTKTHVKDLFSLIKVCAEDLKTAGKNGTGKILTASMMGGSFGRMNSGPLNLPDAGGCVGLLNTVSDEWPGIHVTSVDFDNTLSPSQLCKHITNELLASNGKQETGYPKGERIVFHSVSRPVQLNKKDQEVIPDSDWVILVTGGARGITAETALGLAVYGPTMILVGSTPEPGKESHETLNLHDIAELRRYFLAREKEAGTDTTPVLIENMVNNLIRKREIKNNIARYKEAGARVEYMSTDVRNGKAFGSLIKNIYLKYGRIDGVLHGAGITADKLITDKNEESFNKIFDTKADSTFTLSSCLKPDGLKFILFFTSVAGRYGNSGQADYAAANEILNRFAWRLDRLWPDTRVISINWGPWDETGMLPEDAKPLLKERGIMLINPVSGCRFFTEELQYGKKDEVEIVAGHGPWEIEVTHID